MNIRRAASLIEFLVVLGILAVLVGLLLPALQKGHERAKEMKCKNNLYQLNMGVAEYIGVNKRLPIAGSAGKVGGWSYEVLPFIEQKALYDCTPAGTAVSAAPDPFLRQPALFRCPAQENRDELSTTKMHPANYVLIPTGRRDSFLLSDAPITLQVPWASGPEITFSELESSIGPHRGGFFVASGFQEGVGYLSNDNSGKK